MSGVNASGPASAVTDPGLADTTVRERRPLSIILSKDPGSQGENSLYAEAMGRVDGCPECVVNMEPPNFAELQADLLGYACHYRCTSCRHFWVTSWGAR